MITQNSIMNILIGKNVARTANATAADPSVSTYLADGEIAVMDVSGTVLDSTTVLGKDKVIIVQSQGPGLPSVESPVIELSAIKTFTSKAYAAPVAKIDYIGYDAVTGFGDFDIINANGYEIIISDSNSSNYGSNGVEKFGFYTSGVADTKAMIVNGLIVSLTNNFAHVIFKPFIAERVSSATFTASSGATGTATYTNGSNVITTSGTNPATDFPVGTYIRIGTLSTTTLSNPVYLVTAVSNTNKTITLDQPFQGVSGTGSAIGIAFATATTVNAGLLGIRLTGNTPTYISPMTTEYYVNRFRTTVRNAGATPVVNEVQAFEGSGVYGQIASLEAFLIGNEGFISRFDFPYVTPRATAVSGGTYHIIDLEWNSRIGKRSIFTNQENPKQLMIAFNFVAGAAPTSVTGAVTSVQTVLNAWISSKIGVGTLA